MTAADRELRRFLRHYVYAWRGSGEWAYRGPADFVLREGCRFEPGPLAGYEKQEPRLCYPNSALATAIYDGLRYVEGYAISTAAPGLGIPHAWNIDAAGGLVDLTWGELGVAYLGVVFEPAPRFADLPVIDAWERDWPLLRQPYQLPEPSAAAVYPAT